MIIHSTAYNKNQAFYLWYVTEKTWCIVNHNGRYSRGNYSRYTKFNDMHDIPIQVL